MLNKSGKAFLFSDRGAGRRMRDINRAGEPSIKDPLEPSPTPKAPWDAHAALEAMRRATLTPSTPRTDEKLRLAVRTLHLQASMLLFAARAYPKLREVILDDPQLPADWPQCCADELPGGEVVQGKLSPDNPWKIIRFGGIHTEFPLRLLRLRAARV